MTEITIAALNGIDLDAAYTIFEKSYNESTGKSWSKDQFIWKAQQWEFFGDNNGFITARKQRNGNYKLTGAAGSPFSVVKGMKELIDMDVPIWGAMDDKLATALSKKMGFIRPPATLVRLLVPIISRSGTKVEKVESDGAIVVYMDEIGYVTKYFVCNMNWVKSMVKWMLSTNEVSAGEKAKIMAAVKGSIKLPFFG